MLAHPYQMVKMSSFFVTSSGTNIGKTHLCAALALSSKRHAIDIQIIKPVISGFEMAEAEASDSGILLKALGKDVTPENLDKISPWRFKAPLSPHMAAAKENLTLSLNEIVDFCNTAKKHDLTLIEGVGGIMVPLNTEHTVLDWIKVLNIPAIIVVGSYLGSISHSLTALAVLAHHNIHVAAIVVSESDGSEVDLSDTITTLKQFNPTSAPIVSLPRSGSDATLDTFINILTE